MCRLGEKVYRSCVISRVLISTSQSVEQVPDEALTQLLVKFFLFLEKQFQRNFSVVERVIKACAQIEFYVHQGFFLQMIHEFLLEQTLFNLECINSIVAREMTVKWRSSL